METIEIDHAGYNELTRRLTSLLHLEIGAHRDTFTTLPPLLPGLQTMALHVQNPIWLPPMRDFTSLTALDVAFELRDCVNLPATITSLTGVTMPLDQPVLDQVPSVVLPGWLALLELPLEFLAVRNPLNPLCFASLTRLSALKTLDAKIYGGSMIRLPSLNYLSSSMATPLLSSIMVHHKLQTLHLHDCTMDGSVPMRLLFGITNLTHLSLVACRLTDVGIKQLGTAPCSFIKSIRRLCVDHNSELTDLRPLGHLVKLEALSIVGVPRAVLRTPPFLYRLRILRCDNARKLRPFDFRVSFPSLQSIVDYRSDV
jgi:hypothetical protein